MIQTVNFELRTTENDEGSARVLLRGELDLASAPRVESELGRLRAIGVGVSLDLSELEFMDSGGLVAILGSVQSAREAQVGLEVDRRLRPAVSRLFALTRTDDFLWPADRG